MPIMMTIFSNKFSNGNIKYHKKDPNIKKEKGIKGNSRGLLTN